MTNTIGSNTTYTDNITSSQTTAAIVKDSMTSDFDSATLTQTNIAKSSSVTLSEKSLVLSKLSSTQETDENVSVISTRLSPDMIKSLTEKDLSLVSDMYSDAEKQGTDPTYVDTLAITLAAYRESDNGKRNPGFNEGMFDNEGHQLSIAYSASDTATADRILNSDAMTSTRLDPGFVRYILQPGQAGRNMANMDFIEQTVTKFSNEATENLPANPKFASFSRKDSANTTAIVTATKDVILKTPPSQIANINGHWFILDQSLLKDPAALKATGLSDSQLADAMSNNAAVSLALLHVDPKKINDISNRLLDLLEKRSDL